jgi:general secretion pathway protein K
MLTVIASGFAFSMRSEAMAARNMISMAQARVAADGAIERTVFELSRAVSPETWKRDGQAHAWKDGDVTLTASATDESAKIDINSASEVLLRGLLRQHRRHGSGASPRASPMPSWTGATATT